MNQKFKRLVPIAVLATAGTAMAGLDCPDLTESCFGVGCPDPAPLAPSLKTRVVFCPPVQCSSSYSYAYATILGFNTCPISHGQPGVVESATDPGILNTSTNCNSSACASVTLGSAYAGACAKTDNDEILIESKSGPGGDQDCYEPVAAYATASAGLTVMPSEKPVEVCVDFDTPHLPAEITLTARFVSCGCGWVLSTPNGDLPSPGVTFESANGATNTWSLCCTLPPRFSDFEVTAVDASLLIWDLNSDGRFTPDDIDHIDAVLTACTQTTVLECIGVQFDLSGDGMFDQTDLDLFDDLFACGITTGLFGDANQDGVVDCTDETAAAAFPLSYGIGITPTPVPIGDPDYQFELDHNLDGILDISDQNAFDALFLTCP